MINLTPHAITIRTPDGDTTFLPSGTIARVEMVERPAGTVGPSLSGPRFPVITRWPKGITGLPEDATAPVLVSSMVLDAMGRAGRYEDYPAYAPDTGSTAIRDDQDRIVAVTRLVSLP